MRHELEEFYEMLKLDRRNSSWSRSNTWKKRVDELRSELDEILEAIEKDDLENLEEELGDALWDLLFLLVMAEEKGIMPKNVVRGAMEKLKRRKPWIFTGEKIPSEEEIRRWKKAKETEKRG